MAVSKHSLKHMKKTGDLLGTRIRTPREFSEPTRDSEHSLGSDHDGDCDQENNCEESNESL